jgi:hypothetical protein
MYEAQTTVGGGRFIWLERIALNRLAHWARPEKDKVSSFRLT